LKISAIIPAAGSGQRFGEKKQFKLIKGHTLLYHSLQPFLISNLIHEIIIVVPCGMEKVVKKELEHISNKKPVFCVDGGLRRQDSVKNGILASDASSKIVCIHDAARPFVSDELIKNSIFACYESDGAIVAIRSNDTVKYAESKIIKNTLDRENIWLAQTPQTFWKDKLLKAMSHAELNNVLVTDESSIMEYMGYKIILVEGHVNNFKVTYSSDLERAENWL